MPPVEVDPSAAGLRCNCPGESCPNPEDSVQDSLAIWPIRPAGGGAHDSLLRAPRLLPQRTGVCWDPQPPACSHLGPETLGRSRTSLAVLLHREFHPNPRPILSAKVEGEGYLPGPCPRFTPSTPPQNMEWRRELRGATRWPPTWTGGCRAGGSEGTPPSGSPRILRFRARPKGGARVAAILT